MKSVTIGVFQFTPVLNDPPSNLLKVTHAIREAAKQGAELFLLPELWLTGLLSTSSVCDHNSNSNILQSLLDLAHETGVVVVGTIPTPVVNVPLFYNSTYVISPFSGIKEVYKKIHLFKPMQEERYFLPGNEIKPVRITLRGNREICIGFITCFDLRFPELARKFIWGGVELLLVSALWPESRIGHFDCLLQARAIENQCFVAASNACGNVADYVMGGRSKIIDPLGNVLSEAGGDESLLVVICDLAIIQEVRSRFQTHLPPGAWWMGGDQKIVDIARLSHELYCRRKAGQRIVFTNGCFDLLHAGHVHYLEEARKHGDCLVVAINSDESVRRLKGSSRPINNESYRLSVLSALACVDYLILFDDSTPFKLIESIVPDVLVKGADWDEKEIVGADLVKKNGGEVIRIPFRHNISTTAIVKKVLDSHDN